MPDYPFFVLYVKTGEERSVQAHLESRLKTCWIELPLVISYLQDKNNRLIKSKKLCFDGYVFISADLTDPDILATVCNTPNVLSVFHKHPMSPEDTKRAFK